MSFRLEELTRLSMVKSGSLQPLLIDDALSQTKNLRTVYCMSLLEDVTDLCLLIKY